VCEQPGDDTPRLIYADWLDDHDDHDRAEFIRVQCELAGSVGLTEIRHDALRRRERELLHGGPGYGWSFWCEALTSTNSPGLICTNLSGPSAAESTRPKVTFRRGFVDEVRLGLSLLVGGDCRRCAGRGRRLHQPDRLRGTARVVDSPCPDCGGKDRTEGIARELFSTLPLTACVVSDRKPAQAYGQWCWFHHRHPSRPDVLTELVWSHLPGPEFVVFQGNKVYGVKGYPTRKDAVESLSVGVVDYGRAAAGLPPPPTASP
jgi:uncharacterized protein (TIGR02996 family)